MIAANNAFFILGFLITGTGFCFARLIIHFSFFYSNFIFFFILYSPF